MASFNKTKLEISVEETDLNSNRSVRLDRWLTDRIANNSGFPKISRTQLKNLIHSKCVRCDDKIIEDPSLPIRYGQLYTIQVPEPKLATPQQWQSLYPIHRLMLVWPMTRRGTRSK